MLVPGYVLYRIGLIIWGYIGRTNEPVEEEQVDPKLAKKLAKKQKEEGKQKVKYLKR